MARQAQPVQRHPREIVEQRAEAAGSRSCQAASNFEPAAAVLRGGSSPGRGDWRPPGLAAGNGWLERPGGFECGRRPAARPNLSELDKYSVEPGLLDSTMRECCFSQRTRRLQ